MKKRKKVRVFGNCLYMSKQWWFKVQVKTAPRM